MSCARYLCERVAAGVLHGGAYCYTIEAWDMGGKLGWRLVAAWDVTSEEGL